MLIVVTGKKRSGKDTLGDYLVQNYGFTKTPALADPFKKVACEWFGWNDRHLNGDLKEEIDPVWGFSPRQFFQVFGTEIMKQDLGRHFPQYASTVGDSIWAKVFLNWYEKQPKGDYVLTDMRFPEEYELLSTIPDTIFIKTVSDRSPSDTHASEQHIDEFDVDYTIVNNGYDTLDVYYQMIDEVMEDINAGMILKEERSASYFG
jgi:hypothetical protein